jgi:hypothetical protein
MTESAARIEDELARSIHPEKVFGFLPGMTPANLAGLYGARSCARSGPGARRGNDPSS